MFPLYCNKCFRMRADEITLPLYFSNCGHVVCKNCVQATCAICERKYNPIPIDKHMPMVMAEYFDDAQKIFKRYQKICKFQIEQEARLNHHFVTVMPLELSKLKRSCAGILNLNERLDEDMQTERRRIEKLKKYLAYYEKPIDRSIKSVIPNRRSSAPSSQRSVPSVPPETPTMSTIDSSNAGDAIKCNKVANKLNGKPKFSM